MIKCDFCQRYNTCHGTYMTECMLCDYAHFKQENLSDILHKAKNYKIVIHTNKVKEGYFWCVLDEDDCNAGFGYEPTVGAAFDKAKAMLNQ